MCVHWVTPQQAVGQALRQPMEQCQRRFSPLSQLIATRTSDLSASTGPLHEPSARAPALPNRPALSSLQIWVVNEMLDELALASTKSPPALDDGLEFGYWTQVLPLGSRRVDVRAGSELIDPLFRSAA